MVFNSLTFFVFFAAVLGIYSLPLPWTLRKAHLLVASYLFYAAWNPPFVALLWLSTGIDWFAAQGIAGARGKASRRAWLGLSLGVNLGLLGAFKYGNFALENLQIGLAGLGIDYQPPELGWVLPIGISFYTFQTLSYTLDVYRGSLRPWTHFVDYALYVTFFPQLVAGPIVRARDFLLQCVAPRRATLAQLGWGSTLLTFGLFEKQVLADGLMAPIVDVVFGSPEHASTLDAWIGSIAFSAQIFFDFAGYSTCAIGAGLCLGFALPDNFRCPYAAVGFSDFWRRWHVTLSTWLRDYVYIPLGGNREGRARTLVNLMLTMLVGGLWHGASWHFVVWGGLHGTLLVIERRLRRHFAGAAWVGSAAGQIALAAVTYAGVCLTWVFFRAESLGDAGLLLQAMFLGSGSDLPLGRERAGLALAVTAVVLVGQWWLRDRPLEPTWKRLPWSIRGVVVALLLLSIFQVSGEDRAFIYFQF